MSPLRKLTNCTKCNILVEIFSFRNSVMPEHQWIEKMKNIAKRNIFGFVSFWSGLINVKSLITSILDSRRLHDKYLIFSGLNKSDFTFVKNYRTILFITSEKNYLCIKLLVRVIKKL